MRYYLEILEDGHRLPVGDLRGYPDLEGAQKVALAKVDDALPQNRVWILARVGYAYFGGDGEAYLHDETVEV